MTAAPGIGAEFAGYRIEALLGRGGVGLVYLAQDLTLPRRVALKILRAEYAEDPQFRERFVRESRLAASLDHQNIVPIYKAGEADGVLYIAMRYVDGTDLRRLLAQEGPLDIDRTLGILGQIGSALDAAHAQGLIHRDVKPANILVTPGVQGGPEQAYLVDFGITKRTTTAGLTQAGLFVGTLDYSAPEQIRGQPVDARTDLYSLGCVLFECLSGIAPFHRETEIDTMQAHLSAPRPSLSAVRPEMGAAMDHVTRTAMAREPDDRFGSATSLITAARAAKPWTGVDRRTATRPPPPTVIAPPPPVRPREAPPPAPPPAPPRVRAAAPRPPAVPPRSSAPPRPSAPPPTPAADPPTELRTAVAAPPAPAPPLRAAPPPPPPPRPRRIVPVVVAVLGLILVGVAAVLALGHRGGDTGSATAPSPSPTPTCAQAPPPPPPGLEAALLTLGDFAQCSVSLGTSDVDLAHVTCGSQPDGEIGERHVAFFGRGNTARRSWYNAVAAFSDDAHALAYMDVLTAKAQSCASAPENLHRPPPQVGDGRPVRLVFKANPLGAADFIYDAIYLRHGHLVSLVLVSGAGTEPPPDGDAPSYATLSLQHLTNSGA